MQLSYALNSEAREGNYQITVSMGSDKRYHSFKVEKYGKLMFFYYPCQAINEAGMLITMFCPPVLPKFDVKIDAPGKVSIDQEEIKAEVCAT